MVKPLRLQPTHTPLNQYYLLIVGFVLLVLTPHLAMADGILGFDFPALNDMLARIQQQIPQLNRLVSAFAYTAGVFSMFKAVYELKKYGEMRTMMSNNADLRGPMIMLFVGTVLIFFPQILNTGLTTLFGNANILQYSTTDNFNWDNVRDTIVAIVQVIGAFAFLRGLLFFYKTGSGQSQPGTIARGFTHVIGGALCLNIVAAKDVLYATLGILQA